MVTSTDTVFPQSEIVLPQSATVLFDWGDTLMVDDPTQLGKMCHWSTVSAVDGALETLERLSKHHDIAIATGAADSTEQDIWSALARVGLDKYVRTIFCQAGLGVGKGSPHFYPRILEQLGLKQLDLKPLGTKELGCAPHNVVMVGDSLEKDVLPAIETGLHAIWLQPTPDALQSASPFPKKLSNTILPRSHRQKISVIRSLKQIQPYC